MKIFLTLSLSLTLSLVMSQEAPSNLPDAEVATSHQQVEIDGKTIQLIAQAGTYKPVSYTHLTLPTNREV